MTVDVAEFVALDQQGNGNRAAEQYSVEVGYLHPKVTIADARADEGDAITFTVTLDGDLGSRLVVEPVFTDVTAELDTDYTRGGEGTLTFDGAGDGAQRTFTVATTEDSVIEADETFTVRLGVLEQEEQVIATDTATGTIVDDDSAAVTIADASAEEGDALTFTVTLDKAGAERADGDAELHRRNGDEGDGLHGEHRGADVRGHRRGNAEFHRFHHRGIRWWRPTRSSR